MVPRTSLDNFHARCPTTPKVDPPSTSELHPCLATPYKAPVAPLLVAEPTPFQVGTRFI